MSDAPGTLLHVNSLDTCCLDGSSVKVVRSQATESQAIYSRFVSVVKEIFLPQGYPDSVHPDYTAYQIWDTVQVSLNRLCLTLCCTAGLSRRNLQGLNIPIIWLTSYLISL